MPKRIMISCGELSGDEHAAELVGAIKQLLPDAEFKGMGGRNLRKAGVDTVVDSETSASVMGFSELLGSAGRILKAMGRLKATIDNWMPDLLILTDYPDFNLRLAKYAKLRGVKVLYYIAPQVWAWRAGRVEFFKKYLDKIAVIFPFEKEFLESHGYQNAEYVGHPFMDYLKHRALRSVPEIRGELGLSEKPVLAVFPGSRKPEIEKNLDAMLAGIKMFHTSYPEVQLVLNVAPSLEIDFITERAAGFSNLKIIKHDPLEVLKAADGGLLKSGTSNLQAAALGLPFCMFYIAGKLSALIVRNFVRVKQYSIVNILKPGTVAEILQENTGAVEVFDELRRVMFDEQCRQRMKSDFREISESLLIPGDPDNTAARRTANLAKSLIS